MSKNLITFFILLSLLVFLPYNYAKADTLSSRLKGKILLQVESYGEAWYVNPTTERRHYMSDGEAAYNIMKDLGVGVTNNDLDRVKNDINFAKKHSGKIFLQVEDVGQAYYVDFDGNAHYLKDGTAAYEVMRSLGLGITNNDLENIETSNFTIGEENYSIKVASVSDAWRDLCIDLEGIVDQMLLRVDYAIDGMSDLKIKAETLRDSIDMTQGHHPEYYDVFIEEYGYDLAYMNIDKTYFVDMKKLLRERGELYNDASKKTLQAVLNEEEAIELIRQIIDDKELDGAKERIFIVFDEHKAFIMAMIDKYREAFAGLDAQYAQYNNSNQSTTSSFVPVSLPPLMFKIPKIETLRTNCNIEQYIGGGGSTVNCTTYSY